MSVKNAKWITYKICRQQSEKVTKPLLLTGGEYRIALSATRALGKLGIPVAVLSSVSYAVTFSSKYCSQKIISPTEHKKEEYIDFLVNLVKNGGYSGLIFCDDVSAYHVGKYRERLLPYVSFMLPDQRWLELSVNKSRMMQFAKENGIAIPETIMFDDLNEAPVMERQINYPLVVKGTGGDSGRNLRVVNMKEELIDAFIRIREVERAKGVKEQPMVQEYIQGETYSVIVLCDMGEIINYFMIKKLRTYPMWGGNCVKGESYYCDELKKEVELFLTKVPWHGIAEIEYIKDKRNGKYKLIELSPDFNWALDLAIESGINFPYLLYRKLFYNQKEEAGAKCHYKVGKKFVWFFPEGIKYIVDCPRSIPSFMMDILNPTVGTDLFVEDIFALIQQIKQTRWSLKEMKQSG